MPDLKETYGYKDSRPFGAAVAYSIFKNAYTDNSIELSQKEFAENYSYTADTNSLYINISRNYYVNNADIDALLNFVEKGNTAFIAANKFDTLLLNRLYCKQVNYNGIYGFSKPSFQNSVTTFNDAINLYDETYGYYFYPFENNFSQLNGLYARVVGYNAYNKANCFVFFWGKGRIFFHCEPRTLSNYFLLQKNNYLYLQQFIKMFPETPNYIYWDNYYVGKNYVSNNDSDGSTLSTILKYPALAKAFYILLALLLLYLFFNSKRKQRIVPIIKPNENNSVAFAEAIAGLYLAKKDNDNIAEKIITYFKEQIRSKYFIQVQLQDEHFAATLSRKSGVSIDITTPLIKKIHQIENTVKVTDEQLLQLNHLIETFQKNQS